MTLSPANPKPVRTPSALDLVKVGVTFFKGGRLPEALDKLREAVRLDPNLHEAYANLGVVLAQCGQGAEAQHAFLEAIRCRPTATVYGNLGTGYVFHGRLAEAEEMFRKAVQLEPKNGEYHRHLASILAERGNYDAAEVAHRSAVANQPNDPESHFCLAFFLERMGKFAEAESSYREVTRLRPAKANGYVGLGRVLCAQNKFVDGEGIFRVAIALDPGNAEHHNHLGVTLANQNRFHEAEGAYRKAIALAPNMAMAYTNLGNTLRCLDRYDESIATLHEALRWQPNYPEAHNNLGIINTQLRRIPEAMAHYEEAMRQRPEYPDAHLNRSLLWLGGGDFERGWPEYEWRLRISGRRHPTSPFPRWDGSPLNGRRLLVHCEQGLGDAVQFLRFAKLIPLGRGGRIVLDCPAELVDLAKTCAGIDVIVPRGQPLPECDAAIHLMSLPNLFGTNLEKIPTQVPYLKIDTARRDHWRQELESIPGTRIGIVWQGNQDYKEDRWRSITLSRFARLSRMPGVSLLSLQKGRGAEQLYDGSSDDVVVYDFGKRTEANFADTAALMSELDLVLAVDTSVAHVAGALGLPVWVLIPFASDWRWLTDRTDSPWYPTMRLFRQSMRGDWSHVFDRIEREAASIGRRD